MTKDDKYGFAGVLLCAAVGYYDEAGRPLWFGAGFVLAAWTVWSLMKTNSN